MRSCSRATAPCAGVGEVVGKLVAGDSVLKPRVTALADEHISSPAREKIDKRLALWITARVEKLLGPLFALENPTDLAGVARGIAYQASEALGVLDRARVAQDMKTLDQESRAKLRALGLRFGAYHIYLPALLKPAPRALATQLYALKHGGSELVGLDIDACSSRLRDALRFRPIRKPRKRSTAWRASGFAASGRSGSTFSKGLPISFAPPCNTGPASRKGHRLQARRMATALW